MGLTDTSAEAVFLTSPMGTLVAGSGSKSSSYEWTHSAAVGNGDATQLQSIKIPDNLLLGMLGQCRVTVGMRKSQTILDEDAAKRQTIRALH